MSDSDDLNFYDDHSRTTSDGGGGGFEVFKNVGNAEAIKSIRVALEDELRANEQAPTRRSSRSNRRLSGGSNSGNAHDRVRYTKVSGDRGPYASTGRPPFKKANSTSSLGMGAPHRGPVVELTTERRGSFTRQQAKKKESSKASKAKKSAKKIIGLGGKVSKRQQKLIAESNLNDDEARASSSSNNQCNFLLATMVTGISYYYILSFLGILAWTCVCTYYMEQWRKAYTDDEEAQADLGLWIKWFDEMDVRMIGSLFVFSLVFRFNQCYNRWWQGRMLWGEIIQNCLDFSRKTTLWVRDKEFSDRLNRYIVVFPYAAKAQLRGLSLTDETESGQSLVDRGFLTQAELEFLRENPCWEPEFFLDLMRATVAKIILAQWDREPDEQVLILPHSNRIHDRLFPPMDKAIYDLGNSIGEGVSVRSAGLPRSYDTVHYVFFWIYFLLAPMAEAATIGWLAPVVLGFSSCIIMTLMDMGTAMVDPFGTDLVDLPIERFCETIEAQVLTIQRRHKTGHVLDFATSSTPGRAFHDGVGKDPMAYSSANISGLIH